MNVADNSEIAAGSFGARLGRGFWSICDQGVVSLGNFATQIVLARNLTHTTYGVFVLVFGLMMFIFMCHNGLVAYPLSLEGATLNKVELQRLTVASVLFTLFLSLPATVLVAAGTFAVGNAKLVFVVVPALVLWQVQETLRRGLMAHLRHRDAVAGDSLSYLGQGLILWLLSRRVELSLQLTFLTIGLTSAAAALLQFFQLGWSRVSIAAVSHLSRKFWCVGKWAVLTSMTESVTRQGFPWLLAFLSSTGEAASFQAVMNLVGISHPVLFGSTNLIVPAAAAAHKEKGVLTAAWGEAIRLGTIGAAMIAPVFVLFFVWPRSVLELFYGSHSTYGNLPGSLRLAVTAYTLLYCALVIAAFLYSVGLSRVVFRSWLLGTALALPPSLALTARFGAPGAVGGVLAVALGRLITSLLPTIRTLRLGRSSMLARNRSVKDERPLLGEVE